MLLKLRRAVVRRLPEPALHALVRARYGRTAWQQRLRDTARPPLRGGVTPREVARFDAHAFAAECVAAVSRAFDAAGVSHAVVPGVADERPHVAVSVEHRAAALRALAHGLPGPEWVIEPTAVSPKQAQSAQAKAAGRGAGRRAVAARTAPNATRLGRARTASVYPVLAAPAGELLDTADLACRLEFWSRVDTQDVPRPDGGTFEPGTRLAPVATTVAYLGPDSWQAATSDLAHWPKQAALGALPSLFDVREPVDLVYTWVNGEDPAWLARKAEYADTAQAADLNRTAAHESRYLSREELRYSLRSVAMFASWARRIYLVTDGQVPPWLDTSHPKIQVVDHTEIFRDADALPVFNSHAIESQLHHIAGLSEHYLYLNDDVFFARPVVPELFFHGNGLSKFFLSPTTLDIDLPSQRDLPVLSAAKRNRELIEQRFGATVTNKFKHTPHPQLRSVLAEMEREHPDEFARVARSRFRHPDDLSITSSLFHYYAYGLGRAVPAEIGYVYQDIARPDARRRLDTLLHTRHADVFCLNDTESTAERIVEQRAILTEFFQAYFPVPSPYERTG